MEHAVKQGLVHASADALTGVLAHCGADPRVVRRRLDKVYFVGKAFQDEWQWTDVLGNVAW